MAKWTHPTLGAFTFDYDVWERAFESETFQRFTYFRSEWKKKVYPPTLEFKVNGKGVTPSERAANVGGKTVENHQLLFETGLQMLFDDFRGDRPCSGMWWHSNLDEVHDLLSRDESSPGALNSADDLWNHLGGPSIRIQETGYGYPHPCAILGFQDASFESEHGVGFLTDGEGILGIGYQVDVGAFPE